jgi:hypothetical protein
VSIDVLFERPQYSMHDDERRALLLSELAALTAHHERHCEPYAKMVAALPSRPMASLEDVPFLPVALFKTHRLLSIPDDEIFKVMTSSGTTGQQVSRIYLDRATAERQSRALAAIMTRVLGPRRLPMIVVDTPNVVRDRALFSARGAGVLGMASFGRHHFYALDDDMNLDENGLRGFLDRFHGDPVLIFGFTFMVWKYLYQRIRRWDVDLSRATLVHSGGWKRLQEEAVGNAEFRQAWAHDTGLHRIHNFYGMVEQVGSVFVEDDDGLLHAPNFADVIVRDPLTLQPLPHGTEGVIQVLSALPTSYPGHSLLTEDIGTTYPGLDPAEGWGGTRLRVVGRIPRAELRGCSDTHAVDVVAS